MELLKEDSLDTYVQNYFFKDLIEDDHTKSKNRDSRMTIKIRSSTGETTELRVKRSTQFQKIFSAYAKAKCLDLEETFFNFNGERVDRCLTPDDYHLEDGDSIEVYRIQCGGKPVIVFYSDDEVILDSFKVELDPKKWKFSALYPKPNNYHASSYENPVAEWKNFVVKPNETLQFTETSEFHTLNSFEFLFWEAKSCNGYSFGFDTDSKIYVIKKEEISKFLELVFLLKGMKNREINNDVSYWMEELESKEQVMIQFSTEENYEKTTKFEIETQENKLNLKIQRIFMKFLPISKESFQKIKENEEFKKHKNLVIEDWKNYKDLEKNEKNEPFQKKEGWKNLFIQEWGGMDIKQFSIQK